jgi:zinc protease
MQPWPKGDPRYTMTIDEEIAAVKKVTLADIKAFHKEYIGAGKGELTAVGDFEVDKVTTQVEKLFSGWMSKKPFTRLGNKLFDVAGGEQIVDTKDKENAVLVMSLAIAMRSDDPDYAAWLMVGQILGGDTGSRLWMRVREKEGLSYGTGAWTSAEDQDAVGSMGTYAIVAPQNLNKAKASILDEINKIASGADITDAELARAKDGWIKADDTNLSSDGFVRGMLGQNAYLGRTTSWQKGLRAKIAAVTLADVKRVAAKHVNAKKLVVVSAGDMAKVNAK